MLRPRHDLPAAGSARPATRAVGAAVMSVVLLLAACSGDDDADVSNAPVARVADDDILAGLSQRVPADTQAAAQSLQQRDEGPAPALDGYNELTRPEQFDTVDQQYVLTTAEYDAFLTESATAKQTLIDSTNALANGNVFLISRSEVDEVWLFRDPSSGDHLSFGSFRGRLTDAWVLIPAGLEGEYEAQPVVDTGRLFKLLPTGARMLNGSIETAEGGESFDTTGRSAGIVFADDGTLDVENSVLTDQQLAIDMTPHQLSRAEAQAFLNLIDNVQRGLEIVAAEGG